MKKKIIIILSIINIAFSGFISATIHSRLSKIPFNEIIVNKQLLLLFFLVYILIELAIFFYFPLKFLSYIEMIFLFFFA